MFKYSDSLTSTCRGSHLYSTKEGSQYKAETEGLSINGTGLVEITKTSLTDGILVEESHTICFSNFPKISLTAGVLGVSYTFLHVWTSKKKSKTDTKFDVLPNNPYA